MTTNVKKIAQHIRELFLLCLLLSEEEINELNQELNSLGINAQINTEFSGNYNVELIEPGVKKLQVVKEISSQANIGLKEAKGIVDGGRGNIFSEAMSKEDALCAYNALTDAGATVKIVQM